MNAPRFNPSLFTFRVPSGGEGSARSTADSSAALRNDKQVVSFLSFRRNLQLAGPRTSKRTAVPSRLHLLYVLLVFASALLPAQAQQPDAKQLISAAVQAELASNRNDHSAFQYRDHDITPEHNTLDYVVETPAGNLRRKLEDHGEPLSPAARSADEARLQTLLHDPAAIARMNHDTAHDDNQAEQMLRLLPDAFHWSVAGEAKSPGGTLVTLAFKPDAAYAPANMEARVFAAMAGQVVVETHAGAPPRIYTIRGTLVDDVRFGYGIFGRLRKGGTFEVERREVVPGHWQMTTTHVHLDGKALFFKTIGSQEDESRSDFKLSPATTLQQAYDLLPKP